MSFKSHFNYRLLLCERGDKKDFLVIFIKKGKPKEGKEKNDIHFLGFIQNYPFYLKGEDLIIFEREIEERLSEDGFKKIKEINDNFLANKYFFEFKKVFGFEGQKPQIILNEGLAFKDLALLTIDRSKILGNGE